MRIGLTELVLLIILGIIGYMLFRLFSRSSKAKSYSKNTIVKITENTDSDVHLVPEHARDFISYAEGYVKDITGESLKEFLASGNIEDRSHAINLLILTIKRGDGSERKCAYFALGQIGEEVCLEILDKAVQGESANGTLSAISGARKAILEAPKKLGFEDTARRVIIEEEYYRLSNPKSIPKKFTA